MNLGWTIGEELLFDKNNNQSGFPEIKKEFTHVNFEQQDTTVRHQTCKATEDSCVLGLFLSNFVILRQKMQAEGLIKDFNSIDVVLRGNFLVKKEWGKH